MKSKKTVIQILYFKLKKMPYFYTYEKVFFLLLYTCWD